ncbi:MAG: DUF3857 domain-containing protein [Mucilaginibacter sp.]|nr:DUF3857 domain-containing protein [Mucilaginibacter sp.]
MKNLLLITFILLSIPYVTVAQERKTAVEILQEVTRRKAQVRVNTEMDSYPPDPSAHAFALAENGDVSLQFFRGRSLRLIYYYSTTIKILDEQGFKNATVEIPFYGEETVFAINGSTTYKDADGHYKTQGITGDMIYKIKQNRYQNVIKFALPALKPGCVIEYKYAIASPYFDNFHPWHFEGDIPKVHSEFQMSIPAFLTYNVALRGALNPSKNVTNINPKAYHINGEEYDVKYTKVGMDNVPAFIPEDYMTAPKNFTSALYFELSQFTSIVTGGVYNIANKWDDVDKRLRKDDYFGDQIKKKTLLKSAIKPLIEGKTDTLERAKVAFAYIQKNIKWNGIYSTGSEDIRKALDKHTGDVGDINLALVSALNATGLVAEVVLISTRDHGIINKLYPVITDFDYVIAKVTIGNKVYFLDATDPLLGFGMLPLRSLNDQGRVVSFDKPSYWIDITTQQTANRTVLLNLNFQESGKLKGTFTLYSKSYAAYSDRKAIKNFNTFDEYVEHLDELTPKLKILKSNVSNLDSLDLPLTITLDVEINAVDATDNNRLSFNPYLFDRITVNPFKLDKRIYPVDWAMPSDTKFVLQMQLPEGYTIESPPEDYSVALPNQGGSFITKYIPGTNSFTFSHIISLKKSVYLTEEYPPLKELYNKIILSEKNEMVFKKK